MASEVWKAIETQVVGYRIEALGNTDARNVWLNYDPTQRLDLSDEERRAMSERWNARLAAGQRLKDLPLYRLLGWEVQGSRLLLNTGLTSYKEFLGTDVGRGAAPLALSVVTVTSDYRAVLNQRSPAVAELPGHWHVTPAGHPHPPADIANAVWAELEEELAVKPSEVVPNSLRATGLVTNIATGKPEVTLTLKLSLSTDEVLARTAVDSWEYTCLETLDWSAEGVAQWLTNNVEECVPVGHAALLLAGRNDFGETWFNGLVAGLLRG